MAEARVLQNPAHPPAAPAQQRSSSAGHNRRMRSSLTLTGQQPNGTAKRYVYPMAKVPVLRPDEKYGWPVCEVQRDVAARQPSSAHFAPTLWRADGTFAGPPNNAPGTLQPPPVCRCKRHLPPSIKTRHAGASHAKTRPAKASEAERGRITKKEPHAVSSATAPQRTPSQAER